MAAQVDQDILTIARKYLDVLRRHHYRFESAWLFGSHATGRATPDSDIDIALVMADAGTKFFTEIELTKYRRDVDLRIEPHVILTAEQDAPFWRQVMQTGMRVD